MAKTARISMRVKNKIKEGLEDLAQKQDENLSAYCEKVFEKHIESKRNESA